jgi:hypothetical protein
MSFMAIINCPYHFPRCEKRPSSERRFCDLEFRLVRTDKQVISCSIYSSGTLQSRFGCGFPPFHQKNVLCLAIFSLECVDFKRKSDILTSLKIDKKRFEKEPKGRFQ